ncbi:serine/arginine repetitive matrix protein 1-like [Cydia amplana]|uniref:serine/arginine repetitive matrix protein 1-like n=1 Tax=Cydia amplana TaxID=1869771 RepID=UPI002FE5AE9F
MDDIEKTSQNGPSQGQTSNGPSQDQTPNGPSQGQTSEDRTQAKTPVRVERMVLRSRSKTPKAPEETADKAGSGFKEADQSDTGSPVTMRSQSAQDDGDSDSAMSCSSIEESRFWRKRKTNLGGSGSDTETKRGRGRPPSTGQFEGLARSKEELNRAKREEVSLRAEEEVASLARSLSTRSLPGSGNRAVCLSQNEEEHSASSRFEQVQTSLRAIELVATKSSNLKGTFVKSLKKAVECIGDVFEEIKDRTSSEESRRLQAQNDRLRAELKELRSEMEQLRAELRAQFRRQSPVPSPVPSPPKEQTQPARSLERSSVDDMVRAMTAQVGLMLDARFGALELEGRLLPAQPMRPPLAADRRRQAAQAASQEMAEGPAPVIKTAVSGPRSASTSTPRRSPPNLTEEPQKGSKTNKGKGKGKKSAAPTAAKATTNPSSPSTSAPPPLPSVPASMNEGWNLVTRGKKKATAKSRSASQPAPQQQKAIKRKPRKLRSPRSAAVVLTLHPDAEEKGVTYAQVLSKAKENIDLERLGITAIKFKRAATGARILEVPGATNDEKADSLAKELAEKLGEDIVRVSRPVKCTELRLTELDDSVSPGEVVAAVAKIGGCAEGQIKAGEIRQDASGLGTIWLRCPVTAAKKVVETDRGRLQVGWVRAAVKLLDQRPMRCFKCLEKGHVRAQCTCDADRTDLCYHCGKSGHKAAGCSAPPHCVVCESAGKKADHRLGSKACLAPGPKAMRKKAGTGSRAMSQPDQPSSSRLDALEEDRMATD